MYLCLPMLLSGFSGGCPTPERNGGSLEGPEASPGGMGGSMPLPLVCDGSAAGESPEEKAACLAKEGWRWAFAPEGYVCAPPKPEAPPTEEECLALDGWPNHVMDLDDAPYSSCSLPTGDAGKPCCDSAGCEGLCLAPEGTEHGARTVGTCSDRTMLICSQEVRNGIADGTACY